MILDIIMISRTQRLSNHTYSHRQLGFGKIIIVICAKWCVACTDIENKHVGNEVIY